MKTPISRKTFLTQLGATAILAPLATKTLATAPKKIRIGMIGCGSVSNMYLPNLSKSPFVELVSTCDIIAERAKNAATKYNIPNHYPHIDQLLAGVPFDLMVNLTNMQEHGRLNKLALEAGKNVWSEKPLANSYQEGRALLDLAKSKNLRIWGAPAVVQSPQFAFMAQAIREGKIGRPSAAHALQIARHGSRTPSSSAC